MGQKVKSIAKRGFVGLILVVLLLPLTVLGQATPAPDCSPEAHALILDKYAAGIRSAGADVGAQLTAMQTDLAALDAACVGLAFQGDKGGVVVGPVTIPQGIYRLKLSGGINQLVTTTAVDGTCDSALIMSPSDGGATEQVFRSDGCRILIQVTNSSAGWKLAFALVQ